MVYTKGMQSCTLKKELGHDLAATIVLTRMGQVTPDEGDDVLVKGEIRLPKKLYEDGDISVKLDPRLQFCTRVKVLDESLFNTWGLTNGGFDYRSKSKAFKSTTWQGAFQLAHEEALKELAPLEQALSIRAKALIDAEAE